MTGPGIEARIPPDDRVVIDASVLIAHLMGNEATSRAATDLIDEWLPGGRNSGVISALTVGEAMVLPSRSGRAREFGLGILDMTGLTVHPVDFLVGAEAARIRAQTKLSLPDAVVIATGLLTSAAVLVTNDRQLAAAVPHAAPEMRVCLLSDLV